MSNGIGGILNPLMKRIKALTEEFKEFTVVAKSAQKAGDRVSGHSEEFLEAIDLAYNANVRVYKLGLEWQTMTTELTTKIDNLKGMEDAVHRLADAELIAELTREMAKQQHIAAALAVAELHYELHYHMIKELSTYAKGWETINYLSEAIQKVLKEKSDAYHSRPTPPGR